MIDKITVALAEVPSAKVAVTEKIAPGCAKTALNSEANRKNTLPSATAKLTAPLPALRRAPSRLAAVPRAQLGVAESVSQAPPLAGWRSSSRVTVRAPLPGSTVTRKLPSRAPSALKAAAAFPTLSRSLPRKVRLMVVGGGRLTVALAEVPSAKVAVTEKIAPGCAKTALNSEANRKNTLPSATAKLTAPLPALRRAPSRLAAVPRA